MRLVKIEKVDLIGLNNILLAFFQQGILLVDLTMIEDENKLSISPSDIEGGEVEIKIEDIT